MMLRWLFAASHLLALGIGLGAVWGRARALRGALDPAGLRRVFYADNWWGAAAALWLGTGLVRLLGGLEKGTDYYLRSHLFWGKMTLFVMIAALELSPMIHLVRWRSLVGRGETPDTRLAGRFASISYLQAVLVVLIVLAATAIARGIGAAPRS